MIKILHLISDLSTGGAEMMLHKLVAKMERSKFLNVVVSMTDRGSLGDQIESVGVPVFTLEMRRGVPNPFAMLQLRRLLMKERPQILQTWLYHSDLLGVLVGKFSGVPVIAWNVRCSDMDFSRYPFTSKLVFRLLARLSRLPDAVIVNSYEGRRCHEVLGYAPRQWSVIPNGFDLDQFRPDPSARLKFREELKLPEDAVLIGMIARFDAMKDHENLFRAMQLMRQRDRNVRCVLVGNGMTEDNNEICRIISRYGLIEQIYLLGERHDIPFIMSGLDIMVNSSLTEGFPNVIGEAMACGTSCVVTDVGDSALIVGEAGRVVPPKNPEALAEACEKLIGLGREGRMQLGAVARARIQKHFSISSIVSQYEDFYQNLSGADRT